VSTSALPAPIPRAPPTPAQLTQRVRGELQALLYDESAAAPEGVAIYTLADPRELRTVRYVGQTQSPRRRLLQHIRTARLWLPDERPWWVRSPRLRPLYEWIRTLYQDGERLPVMIVSAWVTPSAARLSERAHICACLALEQPLLNFEGELRRRQPLLL
jgi:hypothetical protein